MGEFAEKLLTKRFEIIIIEKGVLNHSAEVTKRFEIIIIEKGVLNHSAEVMNMILDLKKVFLNENESISLHEDIEFPDMSEHFREPVSADITVRNRAGIAEFLAEVRLDYFCECDRCLKAMKKNYTFQFSHILIAQVPKDESDDYIQAPDYKLDTVSLLRDDILLELPSKFLCKEMIFFWNFRQSSSAKNLVRACVRSAEKI